MEGAVRVSQQGTVTLPADIRNKYGIQPGDTFRLIDLEGVLVLFPVFKSVHELARAIERARLDAGLSTEEMLYSLREQRKRYYRDNYGTG